MPEEKENDTPDFEIEIDFVDCDTESEAKPTITIAERGPNTTTFDVQQPTPMADEEESGDIGIFTSPDGWVDPWNVKKTK